MAEETGQERTEAATPRRRALAREEGNVAKSTEVISVVSLAVAFGALAAFGPRFANGLAAILRSYLGSIGTVTIDAATVPQLAGNLFGALALLLLPFAGIISLAGAGASIAQSGFLISGKALAPKMSRISPQAGLARLFSKRALVEFAKALLKIAVIGGVVGWTLVKVAPQFVPLAVAPPESSYAWMLVTMLRLAAAAIAALAVLALLDFFFQRWDWEKRMRMTRQELKEEFKQHEGDPILKSKIRSRQMDMTRQRMLNDVKTADVVVTNPIHFAVALKYDAERMGAPRVVAKGARLLAARIRDLAKAAGVPVVEDPPLARALYKACKVGSEVPLAFYKAIAELLAVVYRKRDGIRGGVR